VEKYEKKYIKNRAVKALIFLMRLGIALIFLTHALTR